MLLVAGLSRSVRRQPPARLREGMCLTKAEKKNFSAYEVVVSLYPSTIQEVHTTRFLNGLGLDIESMKAFENLQNRVYSKREDDVNDVELAEYKQYLHFHYVYIELHRNL
ncbi:hypothetical protein LINGRAHAP2_LOCUS13954 [Linum grandiflorum]